MENKSLTYCLYVNYLIHGVGLVILTQNMQVLSYQLGRPITTVSFVLSGIGVGRLLAYIILGIVSDYFGRKLLIYIGMISYFIFFVGMAFVSDIYVAYCLAMFGGIANSALDAGTYTTFAEMGVNKTASNILLKAFMSIGEFILPIAVINLETRNSWYGWTFIFSAVLLMINAYLISKMKFPKNDSRGLYSKNSSIEKVSYKNIFASINLSLYGFTSMAMMLIYTQWIGIFSIKKSGYSPILAHLFLSLYSMGSIVGVLSIYILLRKYRNDSTILMSMNICAFIASLFIYCSDIVLISAISAFIFGMTAGGGVMQVGLNIFLRLHPRMKGLVTGLYFTFGSLASISVPIISGWVSHMGMERVMQLEVIVCALSIFFVMNALLILKKPITQYKQD